MMAPAHQGSPDTNLEVQWVVGALALQDYCVGELRRKMNPAPSTRGIIFLTIRGRDNSQLGILQRWQRKSRPVDCTIGPIRNR